MEFINLPILLFSVILVISILTSLISSRANIPLILVFLCIGVLFSDRGGLGIVSGYHQPKVAFFIGSLALALILFDSGFQTNFNSVKKYLKPSVLLASVGVFLTAVLLAPAAHYVGHLSWLESFLLASIISSTDAAAVFFVLRVGGVSIREKIKSTLEMESGSNDPMAIFLTFSFLSLYLATSSNPFYLGIQFFLQMGFGLFGGIGIGLIIKRIIEKVDFDTGLYPVLVIAMALTGFALINMLGGSGFLALYVGGILLGQAKLKGHYQTVRFQTTLTWFSQIILFLTLGFFADMETMPSVLMPALILSIVLMFFARPLAVFLCLLPFHYTKREKLFISFVGLRGATSILLALAPLVMKLENAQLIFSIIFLMVLISLTVQGFLIVPVAKKCRVVLPQIDKPALKSEIDLPGLADSFLITYKLTETTPAVLGAKIPRWAVPVYVQRDAISYKGANIKTLKAGDQIYVFASDETSARELDHFYGGGQVEENANNMGDFVLSPDIMLKDLSYLYNVPVPKSKENMTLRETLAQNFSDLDVGDRFLFGKIELIIRKKNVDDIVELGLNLEPESKTKDFVRLLKFKRKK
ncbi:MAG: potassium/proton antiporter [Alphaproteobacteria bacterium]|nr:potassium/proton antiporter [Alphaproteobacteria bacterium]